MAEVPDDPLLRAQPAEDAGALTQARYRYQADCAALDCIRMVQPDGPVLIVCEWHEDYLVFFRDQPAELVSVKHRESSQGPWRLTDLVGPGGLSHLLSRWLRFDRRPRLRLCTNAGLRPGELEAAALSKACADGDGEVLNRFAARLAGPLGISEGVAAAFLTVLRIDDDRPKRKDIAAIQAVWLRTVLRDLGLDVTQDLVFYERIVALVLRASRDDAVPAAAMLAHLNRPDALSQAARTDLRLTGRVITREDLLTALRDPLPRVDGDANVATRLRLKLQAGGFGPTAVRRAQRLRAAWYAYARAQDDSLSGELDRVRDWVHEQAEASENRQAVGSDYGRAMAMDLREVLEGHGGVLSRSLGLDERLLLGCAFQLTDECLVWWSPEAEVAET